MQNKEFTVQTQVDNHIKTGYAKIRPITTSHSDFESYCRLIRQLTSQYHSFPYETYQCIINNLKNELIYVCELDSVVVGIIKTIMERKLYSEKCYVAHIEDVVIDQEYRGLGIGKKMVDYILAVSKDYGCYKVKLYCKDSNVAFYEKSGFQVDCIDMIKRF